MPLRDEARREALRQAVVDVDVAEVERLLNDAPLAIDDDLVRGVIAAALGNYEAHAALLRALFVGGADVDVADDDFKTTALMLAADAGDLEMVDLVLERGADPGRVDLDGEPALAFALREGHLRIAERLAAAASAPLDAAALARCFLGAAEHGRAQVLRELLEGGDLVLEREALVQAFKGACAAHDLEGVPLIRDLLRPPASRSELGEGLLAALRNLRIGDDEATLARRRAVAQELIRAGADPEIADPVHGATALFFAQEPAIVGALLDAGASPNRRRSDGATPLMIAAGRHDVALMALLLGRGADPHARDLGGRNACAYVDRWSTAPSHAKARDLLLQRRVEPQKWSDAQEARPGAGDWLSLALFVFAIAAIIFGLAVLRCTAE